MYSPPNRQNGGPRYQTLADLALSENENSSYQGSPQSRRSHRSSRRRSDDMGMGEEDEGACGGTGRCCLPAAIVALLLILSLICLSEGWLEALGLRQEVHTKDCLSPKFTKSTLKLLHEEPMQRIANGLSQQQRRGAAIRKAGGNRRQPDLMAHLSGRGIRSSVDLADYYVVFSNSFYLGKFSSDLRYRRDTDAGGNQTNKLLQWPGKDIAEPSSFEALTYNASSDTWLLVQVGMRREAKATSSASPPFSSLPPSRLVLSASSTPFPLLHQPFSLAHKPSQALTNTLSSFSCSAPRDSSIITTAPFSASCLPSS